jgi:hypothetical protein
MDKVTNIAGDEFIRLNEDKKRIGRTIADLQLQRHVIDKAIHELSEKATDKVIQLEMTKNQAGLLLATCFHFAARTESISSDTKKQIDGLGYFILDAMFQQDADFAKRVSAMYAPTSHGRQEPKTPPIRRIPKKDKPYLRYTDEKMEAACERSQIGSSYDYCRLDYARLHLTRTALLEMYRQPRHLKAVFASILASVDAYGGDNCGQLNLMEHGPRLDEMPSTRAKPYEQYSDIQMLAALKSLGIRRGEASFSYGRLTISLHRDSLLELYRQPPHAKPATSFLLKIFDDLSVKAAAST